MQHGVGEQFLEGGLGTGAGLSRLQEQPLAPARDDAMRRAGLSRLQEQPLSPARDDAGASRGARDDAARRSEIQRNEAVL
jgi:hypothetical protein